MRKYRKEVKCKDATIEIIAANRCISIVKKGEFYDLQLSDMEAKSLIQALVLAIGAPVISDNIPLVNPIPHNVEVVHLVSKKEAQDEFLFNSLELSRFQSLDEQGFIHTLAQYKNRYFDEAVIDKAVRTFTTLGTGSKSSGLVQLFQRERARRYVTDGTKIYITTETE